MPGVGVTTMTKKRTNGRRTAIRKAFEKASGLAADREVLVACETLLKHGYTAAALSVLIDRAPPKLHEGILQGMRS